MKIKDFRQFFISKSKSKCHYCFGNGVYTHETLSGLLPVKRKREKTNFKIIKCPFCGRK